MTFKKSQVYHIQNIFFSGLHPDLTYIGARGKRAYGPLGDYHSKLAAVMWQCGLSPEAAIPFFNAEVYQKAGFYDEFDMSFLQMQERAKTVDIEIIGELKRHVLESELFFSVNHPTSLVFSLLCLKIAKRLVPHGANMTTDTPISTSTLPNLLAMNNVFPVYPEIAAYHHARVPVSYNFIGVLPQQRQDILCLEHFVLGEFRCFEEFGREAMAEVGEIVRLMKVFKEFL